MTLNLQLEQKRLSVRIPYVLWSSGDHFGLTWGKRHLTEDGECADVSCMSNIVLYLLGLASNVVPMFLGEMSPKNLRGAIGVVPQLFITLGILVAQILGLNSILGNAEGKAWARDFSVGSTGERFVILSYLLQAGPCCWDSLGSHH